MTDESRNADPDPGFDDPDREVHVIEYDFGKEVKMKMDKTKEEEILATARRYAEKESGLRLDKFYGDCEVPRNLIQRVCGHLLNLQIQAELGQPGQTMIYPDLLKRELDANPEMGNLYINGPQHGVKYYLSGNGAKELIASLRG